MTFLYKYFKKYQKFFEHLFSKGTKETEEEQFLDNYFASYEEFFEKHSFSEVTKEIKKEWLLEKYNILFGYYSVLDLEKRFHYYLSDDYSKDNGITNLDRGFKYSPLLNEDWKFEKDEKDEKPLFTAIRKNLNKNRTLEKGDKTPKFYQHFNYSQETNQIHELYQNTIVQTELKSLDAQIIFAEEILFFIFFREFETPGKKLFDEDLGLYLLERIKIENKEGNKEIRFNFHQLVKYATSVEAKLFKEKSIEKAELNSYFKNKNKSFVFDSPVSWNSEKKEPTFREIIDKTIEKSDNNEIEDIKELLIGFYTKFKAFLTSNEIIKKLEISSKDLVADVVSRFDIDCMTDVWKTVENKCMWDIDIFPMYKSFQYNDMKIKTITFKDEVTINNPVLFHSFVKPIYQISEGKVIDESTETLFGFHLTKEVCKHLSKPLIEDVFVNQIIQHSLRQHQIRSTIAVIMSKNLSHTDGSHVMVDFENKVNEGSFDYKQFKLYNQHLRNTMELVADVSGKIGIQSNYEYDLVSFFADLNNNYFSTLQDSNTENTKMQSKFLGTGLNDGEAHSIIDFDDKKKEQVLFPGGENGKTAFLSILKNIFRNLKKHSSPSKEKIKGKDEHYYKVCISIDDASDELKDDYFEISITEKSCSYKDSKINDNYKTATERVGTINKHLIDDKIIESDGKVKTDGWGLLEIRICAAYLIGLPLDEYDPSKGDGNTYKDQETGKTFPKKFIYADTVPNGSDGYYIRHNFYLRKPKFATIWIDENSSVEKNQKQKLIENAFIIKTQNKDNYNYNSPTEFVIGSHSYKETGKHHNFKIISSDMDFDYDSLCPEKLKECVREKWLEHIACPVKGIFTTTEKNQNCLLTNLLGDDNIDFEITNKVAILDSHCGYMQKIYAKKVSKDCTLKFFSTFAYYEPVITMRNAKTSFKAANKLQSVETIQTKVSIWDERIEKYLKDTPQQNAPDGFMLSDIFPLSGIYTPSDDLHSYFSNKKLENLIADLKKEFEKCDYVILHFSGFETIIGRTRNRKDDDNFHTVESAYEMLLDGLGIKGTSKYLIFTSGKGIPTTLPDKCYFISYTTLEILIKSKPKFDLISTLNSLRHIKK